MKQRVTIYDIAQAAGVSQQTVSLAINNKGRISPNTKKRILALIKDMGYRPNRMAQAMRASPSHMVGLVVPDISNPFFAEVVRGVQDTAKQDGYSTVICNTDKYQEIEELYELVSHGIDGLITFIHKSKDDSVLEFAKHFGPLLLINREYSQLSKHPNITELLVDNAYGAKLAVNHLIGLGHKTIGMLTTHPNHNRSPNDETLRTAGYFQALKEAGLEVSSDLVVKHDESIKGGYRGAKVLLQKRPDVTAIFTYNDLIGLGAIRACLDAQLQVPQDISIIGFDNIELSEMLNPSLSTINVDKYEIGKLAFKRVHSLVQDTQSNRDIIHMKPTLIKRESTGKPKKTN